MTQSVPTWEEFGSVYGTYADALHRHCSLRLGSSADADEIVQDAFMNVWEYVKSGKKIDSFKVFLYRVANNLIVDRTRLRKRREDKEISIETLSEQGIELKGGDEMGNVQRKMEAGRVLSLVRSLGPQDYDLFVMRYVDGLLPSDIALITGSTANNISVRLHRTLKHVLTSIATGDPARVSRRKK